MDEEEKALFRSIGERLELHPGLRYAILKVTNHMMTAHKGVWNWTAREDKRIRSKTRLKDPLEMNNFACG